jgi:protein-tyrosine phosphatase
MYNKIEIIENLYQGGQPEEDPEVDAVFILRTQLPRTRAYNNCKAVLWYKQSDYNWDAPSVAKLHHIADTIASLLNKGDRVLVHCLAGVSRSSMAILAYLMKHQRMTLNQAKDHLGNKNPEMDPASGFLQALEDFEASFTATN